MNPTNKEYMEMREIAIKLRDERDALQAKLDVAVEALKYIYIADGGLYCSELAQEALAKLKGG